MEAGHRIGRLQVLERQHQEVDRPDAILPSVRLGRQGPVDHYHYRSGFSSTPTTPGRQRIIDFNLNMHESDI